MSMAVISMWSLCMSRWESLDNRSCLRARTSRHGCHLHVVTVYEPLGVLRQFMTESAYLHVDGCHLHVVTVKEPLGVLRQPVHVWDAYLHVDGCHSLWMSRWESLDNPFMSESAYLHVDGCHLHEVTVYEPLGVLRQFVSESAYLHVDGCHLHVVTVNEPLTWSPLDSSCLRVRPPMSMAVISMWSLWDEPLGVLRQPVHVWERTSMSMAVISMWSLCMSRWESLDSSCLRVRTSHVDGCHLTCGHMWDEPTGVLRQFMSERYLHAMAHLHVVTVYEPLGVLRQPV